MTHALENYNGHHKITKRRFTDDIDGITRTGDEDEQAKTALQSLAWRQMLKKNRIMTNNDTLQRDITI